MRCDDDRTDSVRSRRVRSATAHDRQIDTNLLNQTKISAEMLSGSNGEKCHVLWLYFDVRPDKDAVEKM